MRTQNLLKISWKAIVLNKMRTFLTMLGIIIGVASVITMLAIGEGSKESIKKQISSMGSNMITIRPGADMRGGVRTDPSEQKTLTMGDYDAIRTETKLLSAVSPLVNSGGQSISGSNNWPTTIYGITPEYLKIKAWEVQKGSVFTDAEIKTSSKVAVIGQTVAKNLFKNGEDPIGKMVRFNSIPFKIIGVLEKKGESTFGQDQDDVILAPYTTVQKRILAIDYLQSVVASSVNEDEAPNAVIEISNLLRKRHNITEQQEDDFNVFSMEEMIATFSSTSEMLTILLVAIASISLLVGGIGIMNIMYSTVTERTKEIGIRRAIGATEKDILSMFLTESVVLSLLGGIVGLLLSAIIVWGIRFFFPASLNLVRATLKSCTK